MACKCRKLICCELCVCVCVCQCGSSIEIRIIAVARQQQQQQQFSTQMGQRCEWHMSIALYGAPLRPKARLSCPIRSLKSVKEQRRRRARATRQPIWMNEFCQWMNEWLRGCQLDCLIDAAMHLIDRLIDSLWRWLRTTNHLSYIYSSPNLNIKKFYRRYKDLESWPTE